MKILRNATHRALLADRHNLGLLTDKHRRLEKEVNRLGDKVVEQARELLDARNQLKKYARLRDPKTGQFTGAL